MIKINITSLEILRYLDKYHNMHDIYINTEYSYSTVKLYTDMMFKKNLVEKMKLGKRIEIYLNKRGIQVLKRYVEILDILKNGVDTHD